MIAALFNDNLDPGFFRDWIIVLACVVGLAIAVITLLEKLRNWKGSPPEMRELHSLEKDIEELRLWIREDRQTARSSLSKVHSRIDHVARSTASIDGKLEQIAKTLGMFLDRAIRGEQTQPVNPPDKP